MKLLEAALTFMDSAQMHAVETVFKCQSKIRRPSAGKWDQSKYRGTVHILLLGKACKLEPLRLADR